MSRTLPQPLRRRTPLVVAVAMAGLSLASCFSGDGSAADAKRVSVVGISFEVPAGWEELDAGELAEGAGESPEAAQVAEGMGISADQLEQVLSRLDLFLVSDEGPQNGFVDNLNVLKIPGRMPNDTQLKMQFMQLGADVQRISRERAEAGEVIVVVYDVEYADVPVEGQAIFIDVGGEPVSVTVSASERATVDEVSDRVLETLETPGEAS